MKKRTAIIAALTSLLPLGQPLVIGGAATVMSAGVLLSVPETAKAESVDFLFERGNRRQESGDYDGALSDFTRIIEINPRNASAYINRGNAKASLGDYQGAVLDHNKAIEINPRDDTSYYNRGTVKARFLQDYYGAISDFSKAIEINPSDTSSFKNRGSSKQRIGDLKGACVDWRKAVSLGHDNAGNLVSNQC